MARVKVEDPRPKALKPDELPADSAQAVYRDKAGASRIKAVTEGGANLASMVAMHEADEAARLAKLAEDEA